MATMPSPLTSALLLALCLSLGSAAPSKTDCPALLVKADTCYNTVPVLSDLNVVPPKNIGDVNTHCTLAKEHLKCLRSYGVCLKPLSRQIFTMIYSGLKKEVGFRCKNQASKQRFLNVFKEVLPFKDDVELPVIRLTNYFDYTTLNKTPDTQITGICCGYLFMKTDLHAVVKKVTNVNHADYIRESVNRMYADAIDFLCAKYSSYEVCLKEDPDSRKNFERSGKHPGHGSLTPMVRFANNLS